MLYMIQSGSCDLKEEMVYTLQLKHLKKQDPHWSTQDASKNTNPNLTMQIPYLCTSIGNNCYVYGRNCSMPSTFLIVEGRDHTLTVSSPDLAGWNVKFKVSTEALTKTVCCALGVCLSAYNNRCLWSLTTKRKTDTHGIPNGAVLYAR